MIADSLILAQDRGISSQVLLLIERKKYLAARKLLQHELKSRPFDTQTLQLLGYSYYKEKRYKLAKDVFDRVDPIDLSIEYGYAWGYTYLKNRVWKQAIYGFKKVPQKSPQRAQAAYFLGFCYYKLKRWYVAESFLRKAKFQDSKRSQLFKDKKRRLKQLIRKKRDAELEEILANSSSKTIANKDQIIDVSSLLISQFKNVEDDVKTDDNDLLETAIEVNQISRSFDNHDLVDEHLNLTATSISLDYARVIQLSSLKKTFGGVRMSLGLDQLQTESTTETIFSLEQTTGNFAQQERSISTESYFKVYGQPFITIGLSSHQTLQLSGNFINYLPQEGGFASWGGRYGKITYGIESALLDATLTLGSGEQFDRTLKITTPEQSASLAIRKAFTQANVLFEARHIERQGTPYFSPSIYRSVISYKYLDLMTGFRRVSSYNLALESNLGEFDMLVHFLIVSRLSPESVITRQSSTELIESQAEGFSEFGLTLKYAVFAGSFLRLQGVFRSVGSYYEAFTDENGSITIFETDAQQTGIILGGNFAPFDWLMIRSDLNLTRNKYFPVNFLSQEDFKSVAPAVIYTSVFSLIVGYEF